MRCHVCPSVASFRLYLISCMKAQENITKTLDERSMHASSVLRDVHDKAKKNGLEKQLEILRSRVEAEESRGAAKK